MKEILKNKKGFSLLELLIYISVLAIVTMVVAQGFLILNKGRAQVEAKSELNSNLRFAMESIKRDIAKASNVTDPVVINVDSSQLILLVGANSVKYSISGNRLVRQVDSNPAESIVSGNIFVSNINFVRLENINTVLNKKNISIKISLSARFDSQSPDWQFSSTEISSESLRTEL